MQLSSLIILLEAKHDELNSGKLIKVFFYTVDIFHVIYFVLVFMPNNLMFGSYKMRVVMGNLENIGLKQIDKLLKNKNHFFSYFEKF